MLKADKERIVSELARDLGAAETLIVADYRGLTNKQLEALRDRLLEHGARFRIVKNTLTRRAAEQAGAEALLVMLEGPTAIAFIESGGDSAAVAKALASTAKEANALTMRGGILEGTTLSGEEIDRLATLPSVDVLRGQLVGAIVAPLTQLLGLVSAPLRDLHGLIDARIKQLEEQGEVATPVAEAAPDEPAAEPEAEVVPEPEPEPEAPEPEAVPEPEPAAEATPAEPEAAVEVEAEPAAAEAEATTADDESQDSEDSEPSSDAAPAEPDTDESTESEEQ